MRKLGLLLLILILFVSCNISSSSYTLYVKAENASYIISVDSKSLVSIKLVNENNKGNDLLDYLNLVPDIIFPLSSENEEDIKDLLYNLSSDEQRNSSIWQGGIDYSSVLLKSDVVDSYSKKLGFDVKPFLETLDNKKAYSFVINDSTKINENNRDHFFLWYKQVLSLSDRR
ncbi:MAG: hypothetical protein JJE21_06370 [Spirochaetaceae bacterium]|nr:hypothetical protein [Spirochaetaceae bacterium]